MLKLKCLGVNAAFCLRSDVRCRPTCCISLFTDDVVVLSGGRGGERGGGRGGGWQKVSDIAVLFLYSSREGERRLYHLIGGRRLCETPLRSLDIRQDACRSLESVA